MLIPGWPGPPAEVEERIVGHLGRWVEPKRLQGRLEIARMRTAQSWGRPLDRWLVARVGQLALEHHDWLNMELAVPRESYREFERLFAELRPRLSPFSPAQPYYTCRVVGQARNVLLAPNYDRDVVFCDVHADPRQRASHAFLEKLEARAVRELSARPHWGKVFFSESEVVRGLYPRENVAAFLECKRRFDPAGVFSNAYTRRVFGV